MNYTLEVIITVLEILKEKAEAIGQVNKNLEKCDNPPIAIYCNGQAEAFETCIKLLKGLTSEENGKRGEQE